jgi:hypothetical protein
MADRIAGWLLHCLAYGGRRPRREGTFTDSSRAQQAPILTHGKPGLTMPAARAAYARRNPSYPFAATSLHVST